MRASGGLVIAVVLAGGGLALPRNVVAASSEPLRIDAPSRKGGATTARITSKTFARRWLARSDRGRTVLPRTSWSKHQQTLLVLAATSRHGKDWIKVLLSNRPTGATGWIPRDRAVLDRTRYWIDVRLHRREVRVYRRGKLVRRFRAVVGARDTPTPRGLAAIYEQNRQPDPHGFLGPWALALTSTSAVLEDYGGGPGRVAIHGRDGESLRDPLGTARSHGCIRISDRNVRWLAARVPVGTPVRVRR